MASNLNVSAQVEAPAFIKAVETFKNDLDSALYKVDKDNLKTRVNQINEQIRNSQGESAQQYSNADKLRLKRTVEALNEKIDTKVFDNSDGFEKFIILVTRFFTAGFVRGTPQIETRTFAQRVDSLKDAIHVRKIRGEAPASVRAAPFQTRTAVKPEVADQDLRSIQRELLDQSVGAFQKVKGGIMLIEKENSNPKFYPVTDNAGLQDLQYNAAVEKLQLPATPNGSYTKIPLGNTVDGAKFHLLMKGSDGIVREDSSYFEPFDKIDNKPYAATKEEFLQARLNELAKGRSVLFLRKESSSLGTSVEEATENLQKMEPGSYCTIPGKQANESIVLLRGPIRVEQHTIQSVERQQIPGATVHIPPLQFSSIEQKQALLREIKELDKHTLQSKKGLGLLGQFQPLVAASKESENTSQAFALLKTSGKKGQYELVGKPYLQKGLVSFAVDKQVQVIQGGQVQCEDKVYPSLKHLLVALDLSAPLYEAQIKNSIGLQYVEASDMVSFESNLKGTLSKNTYQVWHVSGEPERTLLTASDLSGKVITYEFDFTGYTEGSGFKITLKSLDPSQGKQFTCTANTLFEDTKKNLNAVPQSYEARCAELQRFTMEPKTTDEDAFRKLKVGQQAFKVVQTKAGLYSVTVYHNIRDIEVGSFGVLDQGEQIKTDYELQVLPNGTISRLEKGSGAVQIIDSFGDIVGPAVPLKNLVLTPQQESEAEGTINRLKAKAGESVWYSSSDRAMNVFADAIKLGVPIEKNKCLFYREPGAYEVGVVFMGDDDKIQTARFDAVEKNFKLGDKAIPFDQKLLDQFSLLDKARLTVASNLPTKVAEMQKIADANYQNLLQKGADLQKTPGFLAGELTKEGAIAELKRLNDPAIAGKTPGSWLVIQQEIKPSYVQQYGVKLAAKVPFLSGYARSQVQPETGTYLFAVMQASGEPVCHEVTINSAKNKYVLGGKEFDSVTALQKELKIDDNKSLKTLQAKDKTPYLATQWGWKAVSLATGTARAVGTLASWIWSYEPSSEATTEQVQTAASRPIQMQPVAARPIQQAAQVDSGQKVDVKEAVQELEEIGREQESTEALDPISQKLEELGGLFLNEKQNFWGIGTKHLKDAQISLLRQVSKWNTDKVELSPENAQEVLSLLLTEDDIKTNYPTLANIQNLPVTLSTKRLGILPPEGKRKPERDAMLKWVWDQCQWPA